MTRTTRNSQRAASHAIPPSASRPASPYDFNTNPAPFPSMDSLDDLVDQHLDGSKIFENQVQEQPPTFRRRSSRQALKAIPDAPTAAPVPVSAANSSKGPSPAPFRRPPTGSKANRSVLGDLMPPPPAEATPSVAASNESGEENDENAVPPVPTRLVPIPYNAKYRLIESKGRHNPFWQSWRPPVHEARFRRPTEWDEVGYYQENEWDTDTEEYTRPTPRAPFPGLKAPKTDRDPSVLSDEESYQREGDKKRREWGIFKPTGSRYMKSRLRFPALREGKKLRLVEDNGKAQYWEGVETPQKVGEDAPGSPRAKFCTLPEDDGVYFDENGDPLPNPDIHPSTNLPTADWLADHIHELAYEAELMKKELERVKTRQALTWGKLMIENDDLEEDEKGIEKLLEGVKKIVPPDVFKKVVSRVRCVDMDDPENKFGPAKYSPYDEYVLKMATQRQPVPPPPRTTAPTARATSSNGNTGPKPKRLARATYEEKMAMAEAFADLQAPPADGKTRQKAKPRARAADVEENEDQTDVEEEDGEEDGDGTEGSGESSDGEADEENEPRTAPSQVHVEPSSPDSEKSDGEDADDENESPVKSKKRTNRKEDQAPDNEVFDDFYADEEETWAATPGEVQQSRDDSEDEESEGDDSEEADEEVEEEPIEASASQTAATFVIWNDSDGKAGAEKKTSGPKSAPLGPKRMPSSMPNRNLKRDRDESDDEISEGSDEENDENKDFRVHSKKRRVSGYYGANDENAPLASAPQAERDLTEIYEDDESSANRPLSPISERPSSEEREEEEVEASLSFIDDVEMSNESDGEQNDENAAPAPPAATTSAPAPAPAPAPLLPAPVIVPSVPARRARPLRRDVVTVVGNRRIIWGEVFEVGE